MELISFENLTLAERTAAKNKEASKVTIAKLGNVCAIDISRNLIVEGLQDELIARSTKLSWKKVQALRKELKTCLTVLLPSPERAAYRSLGTLKK